MTVEQIKSMAENACFYVTPEGLWLRIIYCAEGSRFADMSKALAFMQMLRDNSNNKFISMASESVENVGKLGVDTVVDGKCPDGGDFLGRLSRHGMMLKRGR